MINMYETAAVRKHVNKLANPGFEATQMAACTRTLWVGGSGSGKTCALANYLKLSPNCFSRIIVCNAGIEEPIYQMMQEQLKGQIVFYTLASLPPLAELVKGKRDKGERWLLILDDVVADIKARSNVYLYFIASRKHNFDVHLLSQSFYKTPKLIRSNINYLCMLRIGSDKDLQLILSDCGAMGVTKPMLMQMYKSCVKERFHFMKIALDEADMNKRFSHNFTDFFELEDAESGDTTS